MIRYYLNTLVAHLCQAGTLFLLTVLGVALGVASVLSVQIINLNAIGAFSAAIQTISGEADLSVVARTDTFSEELYPEALATEGVSAAWPVYRVDVTLVGRDNFFLEVFGVDLISPVHLPWSTSPEDLSQALCRRGWIAVTPALAHELGWSVGDSIQVTAGSRRVELVVGALVDFQRVIPMASRRLAVMDIGQAQGLLGDPGQIHQIDIQIQPGLERSILVRRLRDRLGPSVEVRTPEQRENQGENLLSAFRLNLTALSLISLFVGLFVVHTSTQASLLRRRSEFGLLRSLGATREQVLGLILGEVVLLGLLGAGVGLPLGYWIAQANVDMVSSTLTNLYLLQEIESLQLPAWLYSLAAAIGLGGAIGGALLPALDMSRRDAKSLLAAFTLHEKVGSLALPLLLTGFSVMGTTGVWFWLLGRSWKPSGFILAVALLIGLPLLTPFLVQQLCGRIRLRSFGFTYSLKSMAVSLQTTSFAVASLGIAVTMLIGITLMIGSFRSTVEVWVETTVRADIYVTTESWKADPQSTLDSELVSLLASYPGVAKVDRLRKLNISLPDRRIPLAGVDMQRSEGGSRFPLIGGSSSQAMQQVQQGGVLISEPLSRKTDLTLGDTLVVLGPEGELEFPIAGVYYDYTTEAGSATMDLTTMAQSFGPGAINAISLYLDEGLDPEEVVDKLKAHCSDWPLRIRSNRGLREEIFRVFDQTFAVVRILQVMSLLIAVCGIMLTLLILAREQVRELAVYRVLGAHPLQIFRIFVGKGLVMGLMGLVLGSVGGVLLALILIFVINRSYFGWTIQLYWPWQSIAWQVLAILMVALLASLYPALRASRVTATELSRDDL